MSANRQKEGRLDAPHRQEAGAAEVHRALARPKPLTDRQRQLIAALLAAAKAAAERKAKAA